MSSYRHGASGSHLGSYKQTYLREQQSNRWYSGDCFSFWFIIRNDSDITIRMAATEGIQMGTNYPVKGNLFAEIHKQLGLMPGFQGLGQDMSKLDQQTQTPGSATPLEKIRLEAEVIAADVISSFGLEECKKPVDRYCKTMRRTVRELSDRHDIAFKGMVNKLNVDDSNAFPTFVSVVDEIFEDGQINWGRIVAVYTFASRLALHCRSRTPDCDERIALYAGKYVASKLGRWILDNNGWDAFADYFPEQGAMEDKLWKGLVYTAMGLGALATMVATR